QLGFRGRLHLDDAETAYLQLAAQGCRRLDQQTSTLPPYAHLVVGDKRRRLEGCRAAAGEEQEAQGKIRLARPRRSAQQQSRPAERHAGAVHELSCVGQAAALLWLAWHPPPAAVP